ncbi:hypothetical protein EA187_00700 [Lujinxingia sediminis]|uniref:NAD(P)-dependent oxidoreductase n=1 Tax=Lujinxingia sediminis TaxID=2480984 RepID=A0ABY0CVY6_9DELT|nr:hypothetical protein [Lujinxingia sediminis]RVU47986.1 hypothetical protein EA187_00700 [Lujinxingia sediminis]
MASQQRGRAAICGADELVGGQIARRLVDEGVEVRALVDADAPRWHLDDIEVDWRVHSRAHQSAQALEASLVGCGVFFIADVARHARGAPDASTARRIAVRELRMRLDAALAAQVPRVVVLSGQQTLELGAVEGPPARPDETGTSVREALIAVESEIYRYVASGMHICLVVASPALGPGDVYAEHVSAFVQPLAGWDGFVQICDARDVAQVVINAARRGRAGRRYPFLGEAITLERFSTLREEHGGGGRPVNPECHWPPAWAQHPHALKSELAAGELGVRTRPLALTLRDAARWYRRAGMFVF